MYSRICVILSFSFLSSAGCNAEIAENTDCVMEPANGIICDPNNYQLKCPTIQQAKDLNPANRCKMIEKEEATYLCCVTPSCC